MAEGKKTGGRQKGTPNKDNKFTRDMIAGLLSENGEKFRAELEKLSGRDYVKAILELMQYNVPKLKMAEIRETTTLEEFIAMSPGERKELIEKLKQQAENE